MLAWHFRGIQTSRYGAEPFIVRAGATQEFLGTPLPGTCGLHASRAVIEALKWAPGPILERVSLDGEIVESHEQLAAQRRTTLWLVDATEPLQEFVRHYLYGLDWSDRFADMQAGVQLCLDEERPWSAAKYLARIVVARTGWAALDHYLEGAVRKRPFL